MNSKEFWNILLANIKILNTQMLVLMKHTMNGINHETRVLAENDSLRRQLSFLFTNLDSEAYSLRGLEAMLKLLTSKLEEIFHSRLSSYDLINKIVSDNDFIIDLNDIPAETKEQHNNTSAFKSFCPKIIINNKIKK